MNILLLLKPTDTTDISHFIKKPQTENNQFFIDFNPASTSRTKCSASLSPMEAHYKTRNMDIKLSIANYFEIRPDGLQLYNKDNQGVLIELKDHEVFNVAMLNNFKETLISSPVMFAKFSSGRNKSKAMLYFSLSPTQHKIRIDFFNHNIEKMIFDVSSQCSVYLLKHMISQKTSYLISKENQILYSAGLVLDSSQGNSNINQNLVNKMYLIKSATSHKLSDETTVNQIINYYNEKNCKENNSNVRDSYIINLIFAEKNKDKYQIGLDFSFNIMRTSNKINFDVSAPEYREVSDGLNLFSYCYNSNCAIFKEMFTAPIGYGQFDIIKLCRIIYCPICKDKTQHEVKNIGMINGQWKYKGFLNGQEASKCEGDGFTIDNQLYVLSEMNIVKQFSSLLIEIKSYSTQPSNMLNTINNNIDEPCSPFEDLDAIDLYTPNKEKFDKIANLSKIQLKAPITMSNIVQNKEIVKSDNINDKIIIDQEICTKCAGVDTLTTCVIF